jgi:hypothetical protein
MAAKRTKTPTPEEIEERVIRSEAVDRWLKEAFDREAERAASDPNYRGVGYWIEQVRAERRSQEESAA